MSKTKTTPDHPMCAMCDSSKQLRERAAFANRQAQTGVARAQKAGRDIASLDIEGAFRQLRQLVAIVGGKSRHAETPNPARTPQAQALMAAE